MKYNRELAKRFVKDYNLPIPIINEEYFFYYLNLYEEDYESLTKYKKLISLIDEEYDGDFEKFLSQYYDIRDNIISSVMDTEAFKQFNTMDMSAYVIKERPNISSNNIYNEENIGKFFISIDLKKANFQTLKKINKEIVFDADTYEDFIEHFTDSFYVKESKYTREVVFGKLNPKRHITAEKFFTYQLYQKIIEKFQYLDGSAVSLSNDEIVFNVNFLYYNDKFSCYSFRKQIEEIASDNGFSVRVEFFHLKGYNLVFKESRDKRKTFYVKDYFCTDEKFKLIAAPLQYHAIIYKLYKDMPFDEIDYHFDYEGMNARFCEEFDIEEIK